MVGKGLRNGLAKQIPLPRQLLAVLKKHGGPDHGPVRARKAWAMLGVDGLGVANEAPAEGFIGMPKLTPRMIAWIQGFPDTWSFETKKPQHVV